jgi:hypothetical protein
MRRDIYVHPIIIIGCIGPAFLCIFTCILLYFQIFQPQLIWFYGAEMETAIRRYEQIRIDVFKGDRPESSLEMVSVNPHLKELQDTLNEIDARTSMLSNTQPIVVTEIRELTNICGLVIMKDYLNRNDVAFVLMKVGGDWKVRQIYNETKAGLAPLPLKIC